MEKIKLGVVFGGKSSEYSVSLHSAASLLRNIPDKYELHLIGITPQGKWYYVPKHDFDAIEHDHWLNEECCEVVLGLGGEKCLMLLNDEHEKIQIDVIFPCLHGKNGEDGTVQGYLELAQIPYVGCGVLSSSASMDKEFTHILCESAQVPCAPYICVHDYETYDSALYEKAVSKLGLPIFIKPCNAGSSYGISKVRNEAEFLKGMQEAFKHDTKVLCEKAIDGFEIGCAVMGNHDLIIGECDEIDTHKDFFDFAAKYDLDDTQIYCPARINAAASARAKEMAQTVYRTMNCSGMARVDMFVCKDGSIIFNELNTIPGFTATSRYPSMMKAIGLSFSEVIDRLIQCALNK